MEMVMKNILSTALLAGFALSLAAIQPAAADAGICLRAKNISSSDVSKDGSSITFQMKDGKIYRNDLAGSCPDAWFNGFAWSIKADEVCDNEPGLKVLNSGQICHLGKFTEMTPAPRN